MSELIKIIGETTKTKGEITIGGRAGIVGTNLMTLSCKLYNLIFA